MSAGTFVSLVIAGLSGAAILFLVGSGLTLVFGALRIINMAHGSLYMVAAFVAVAVGGHIAGEGAFWLAIVAGSLAAAALGGLIEVSVLRRLYNRDHLFQLLATFALVLIISGLVRAVFGTDYGRLQPPGFVNGSIGVGSTNIAAYQLFLIVVAAVVAAALWATIYGTSLGRLIRAALADPELLALSGVNVARLFTGVFCIGALLAGIGGAVIAGYQSVSLGIDVDVVVEAFAVTIIGGLGSLGGALIGAALVGMVQSFGIYYAPRWSLAFIFLVMVAVLAVRPSGLFGAVER